MKKNKISKNWIIKQHRDPFFKESKIKGYRSRSAFKLIEMKKSLNNEKKFYFAMLKNISYKLTTVLVLSQVCFADASRPWQMDFQDPATPIMEGIINFHNHIMFFITVIVVFVSWLMVRCIYLFEESVNTKAEKWTHSTVLEIVWTIIPAVILMLIAIPSFALLFSMDEVIDPAITLKVVGHQWYWSYEYSDYCSLEGGESLNFDSYMIPEEDLTGGGLRLLEVDNRLVLPVNTHIRCNRNRSGCLLGVHGRSLRHS